MRCEDRFVEVMNWVTSASITIRHFVSRKKCLTETSKPLFECLCLGVSLVAFVSLKGSTCVAKAESYRYAFLCRRTRPNAFRHEQQCLQRPLKEGKLDVTRQTAISNKNDPATKLHKQTHVPENHNDKQNGGCHSRT